MAEARGEPTWVTPTRRLAHHLRLRHDEDCLARGLEAWPSPDIVTWGELVRRMFERDRQAGRSAGRWLPETAAQLVWERIVRHDPASGALVSPSGVARSACLAWQRMHAHLIPRSALTGEGGPESDDFARWVARYEEWLAAQDWVDPWLAPRSVTAAAAGPRLEFVGFDSLTPAQRDFQSRLCAAGVEIANAAPHARRGDRGWVYCNDRRDELETAARWAAWRLEQSPARLAIVLRDLAPRRDEVRRIIERVLAPATTVAGGPPPESAAFEIASARPLASRPIVAAALDALEAFAAPADLAAAGRLLRSAFLRSSGAEADARARLDARLRRDEALDLGLERLARLAAAHACPALAEALDSALRLRREWPPSAEPNRWTRVFFELLAALGWPGEALDSSEHQAEARWSRLVAEFGACDDYVGTVGAREAVGLLREMAEGVLFEPEELRAPLLVIDAETCAGMSFDALWVCGLDDARWPAAASPDPFLPRSWQARQGLPGSTAELAAEDARRLLARLCSSADEVILSVPQYDDDAPLLPSPLLAAVPRRELPQLWPGPSMAALTYRQRPQLESFVDAAMPPLAAREAGRGGARLLELQSACPFRAHLEQRLGARALEESEPGIDAAARGELVHAVLARLWQALGDSTRLRGLDDEAVHDAVRQSIAAELDARHRTVEGVRRRLLEIEASWLETRVLELLQLERTRPDFAIDSVEQGMTITVGGLTLELRPDRIDRLSDGRLAVVDYKTGGDAEVRAWLDERPRLPQLPLYATALGAERVGAVVFARVRTGDTGFTGLVKDAATFPGLKSPGIKGWPREFDGWEQMLEEWRRRLTALAEEHVRGDARLAPDPRRACLYCHLATVCRIAETRSGRAGEALGDD